ncbi:MAG TPA: DUF4917 family protein [Solirubrobacterales bacterium]|nr:DUF4917 family protein [Solirubrobacterales bacterium]
MALESHQIDASLLTWQEVTAEYDEWSGLLLGNGLSRSVCGDFGYPSLFEKARQDGEGSLTDDDRRLFETLDTKNFERVLAELAGAIRIAEALEKDPGAYLDRYRSIQQALGSAVQSVHVDFFDIPKPALQAIGRVFQDQAYVFTTSYDLIVYWAMGAVGYERLCDCFWDDYCFDPADSEPPKEKTPVYFLHGALHLMVMGSGVTRKRVNTSLQNLLEQFGRPLDGDEQARPLLITEGSSQHKLLAIEGNGYLSDALNRLRRFKDDLVVFGSELGKQDQHLVEALNRNPKRRVAVSVQREGRSAGEIRAIKANLLGGLDAAPLLFFDAATHPLGRLVRSGG